MCICGFSDFVLQRVFDPRLFESFESEQTTIAGATGESGFIRVIATVGEPVIDAEVESFFDDLGFGHVDERGVDFHFSRSFHTGFGGQVGECLERADKFGTAVRISAIIDRVHPDKNIVALLDLGIGQRIGQKDGVPRWHVGDGDT